MSRNPKGERNDSAKKKGRAVKEGENTAILIITLLFEKSGSSQRREPWRPQPKRNPSQKDAGGSRKGTLES